MAIWHRMPIRRLYSVPALIHFSIAITTSSLFITVFAAFYILGVIFRVKYYFFSTINRSFVDQLKNSIIIVMIGGSETLCCTLYLYRVFLKKSVLKRIWGITNALNLITYSTPVPFKFIIAYIYFWIPFFHLLVAYLRRAGLSVYAPYAVHVFYEMKCALVSAQFCSILFIVTIRIDRLKFKLKSSRSAHRIETICYKKEWLLALAKLINHFYGPILLGLLLLFFANFTSIVYLIWGAIRSPVTTVVLVLRVLHSVVVFSSLLFITSSCESLRSSAESFNNELFKMMRESKDLCSNEKLHLYVTMKQTLNFTACGFFAIGYPLVTSIIAAATTYLVILVQFSMGDSSSGGK